MSTTTTEAPPAAAAAATSAASGQDTRPKLNTVQTSVSASYPSELRSPHPGTPAFLKREESIKTPITPPTAYHDFLKSFGPALMTPPTTGNTARFPSSDKSMNTHCVSSEEASTKTCDHTNQNNSTTPLQPLPQSTLIRQTSSDSTSTTSSSSTTSSATSGSTESIGNANTHAQTTRPTNITRARPESPRIVIPPSPFVRPGPNSARRTIPPSPLSGGFSARSPQSPYTQTPWSGTFSPHSSIPASSAHPSSALTRENLRERDRNIDHTREREKDNNARADDEKKSSVCVRQTVTRTVMYSRTPKPRTTPLDPAPEGKRRRVEGAERVDAGQKVEESAD
ncbi:hypothetical protein MBLNU457_3666t1 [Dothideomycetes sp. NU457]